MFNHLSSHRSTIMYTRGIVHNTGPHSGSSVVSVSDPGGCEFDPQFRQTFFPAYFRLSPLQKHVRKVVGGFGKKIILVLV